jgi:hypothetical protein
MKEVSLQGVQISPAQLDVKQHSNKTLSELQRLLQTASTLKGAVASSSKSGDVIFTTAQGKFSAQVQGQLPQTLNKGDKLIFKLEINNEQLFGLITTLNGSLLKGAKPIALTLVTPAATTESSKSTGTQENIDINNLKMPDAPLKAVISYLNLSHISKNSALSKVLTSAANGSSLEFKVIASGTTGIKSPYIITGEVLASEGDKQTIKTPFGILTSNHAEILPAGKRIQLEIKAVDNKPVDNTTFNAKVEDFIFKLNNSSPLLKNLLNTANTASLTQGPQGASRADPATSRFENSLPLPLTTKQQIINGVMNGGNKSVLINLLQTKEQLSYLMNNLRVKTTSDLLIKLNELPTSQLVSTFEMFKISMQKSSLSSTRLDAHQLQTEDVRAQQPLKTNTIIEKALELPQAKEAILRLAEDFNKIKELFNSGIRQDESNKWQNFFIPIYDGERVSQNKVSIHKKPNQYIRFIVELAFEETGDIQLDGLIKLKPDTNIPENFDLTVRFKDKLSRDFQTQIFEIYKINQDISGIKGGLDFENVKDFSSEAVDP